MAQTRITSNDILDGTILNADINASAAINASKIADGTISNTEFQQLNGIGSQAVGISDANALTNKTMTGLSNIVSAHYLINNGKQIAISGNSDPSSGQVLTATSATAASWQSIAAALSVSNFVFNEVPTGTINGSNDTFGFANTIQSNTQQIFKNGLLMLTGASNDYTMAGLTGFVFVSAQIPQVGDTLVVHYIK